jgi:predicted acyl esterase
MPHKNSTLITAIFWMALLFGCGKLPNSGSQTSTSPALIPTVQKITTWVTPQVRIASGVDGRISSPGIYQGFSQPLYAEMIKTSQYVSVRDGTKLAVDIYRPAIHGQPVNLPLPVIWMHARFHRKQLIELWPWYQKMVAYGYVIGAVDVRGSGASYGTFTAPWSPEETLDAYDITEWFAAQPWSDGNIGMFGFSYQATNQLLAASSKPPHLKAIFPFKAQFDLYSNVFPGGVFSKQVWAFWNILQKNETIGVPVDEDYQQTMLSEATQQHRLNQRFLESVAFMPYRDSRDPKSGASLYLTNSPNTYLDKIQESGVAIYIWGSWYDPLERDTLLWFMNLSNPKKMIIGSSSPIDMDNSPDEFIEHLRWFDYWLKGIDNGIMNEDPIYYYTKGPRSELEWRSAWQWPLSNQKPTNFYFNEGLKGALAIVHGNYPNLNLPGGLAGEQGSPSENPAASYEKYYTFTSSPLASEMEITGQPVIHLWVTSTAKDSDFFVYLQDTGKDGENPIILTEGTMRASHRAISTPPYNNLDLPYHRSYAEDSNELSDQPTELAFDLMPVSYVFQASHRIQIIIICADKVNILPLEESDQPVIGPVQVPDRISFITLPVILRVR